MLLCTVWTAKLSTFWEPSMRCSSSDSVLTSTVLEDCRYALFTTCTYVYRYVWSWQKRRCVRLFARVMMCTSMTVRPIAKTLGIPFMFSTFEIFSNKLFLSHKTENRLLLSVPPTCNLLNKGYYIVCTTCNLLNKVIVGVTRVRSHTSVSGVATERRKTPIVRWL
jgi:hypothetical protein